MWTIDVCVLRGFMAEFVSWVRRGARGDGEGAGELPSSISLTFKHLAAQ